MTTEGSVTQYKFCPLCGGSLETKLLSGHSRLICPDCGFVFYQNPVPAVAVILMQDHNILLVKRKYKPKAGKWSLPAGFIENNESPEQAAMREVVEETGLVVKIQKIFGVYEAVVEKDIHIILIVYEGEIIQGLLTPGDDAVAAEFFSLDALPQNIAFSRHREVLEKLRRRNVK